MLTTIKWRDPRNKEQLYEVDLPSLPLEGHILKFEYRIVRSNYMIPFKDVQGWVRGVVKHVEWDVNFKSSDDGESYCRVGVQITLTMTDAHDWEVTK